MNEQNMLPYLSGGDAFSQHVRQSPELAAYVDQKVIILKHTFGSPSILDMQAARDAANGLYMTACAEGFPDIAAVFYSYYELLCHTLMLLL